MSKALGFDVELSVPFELAVSQVKDVLKIEGFGVLTEIDLQAAFKEKLGRDFRPYVILGSCNPPLAHTAVSADPEVGLLLPCNVTVEADSDGGSVVRLVDPERLLTAAALDGSVVAGGVAKDAAERLRRVAGALSVAARA